MHINKDFIIFKLQMSNLIPLNTELSAPAQHKFMYSSKVIEGCALSAHHDTAK